MPPTLPGMAGPQLTGYYPRTQPLPMPQSYPPGGGQPPRPQPMPPQAAPRPPYLGGYQQTPAPAQGPRQPYGYGSPNAQGFASQGVPGGAYGGYPGRTAPAFPGYQPTAEYSRVSDPSTANLEALMNYQIPYYMQPVRDPARDQYAGMLQNYVNALSPNDPAFQNLMGTLNSVVGQAMGGPSPAESGLLGLMSSLSGGGNADAYAAEYRKFLTGADPYTDAEWEAYRTNALDPIERDRTAAHARVDQQIAQQGIEPTSGIALALHQEADRGLDQARAAAQNQLAIQRVEDRANRQGLAFQAGLSAEQLKNQARSSAISAGSAANSAWANRLGLGMSAADALAGALPGRLGQQLLGGQSLFDLSTAARGEQDQRYAQALQLAQYMSELPGQRQAQYLQTLGQETPGQTLNALGNIGQNNMYGMNQRNQMLQTTFGGLGTLFGYGFPIWGTQPQIPGVDRTTYSTLPFPLNPVFTEQMPVIPSTPIGGYAPLPK